MISRSQRFGGRAALATIALGWGFLGLGCETMAKARWMGADNPHAGSDESVARGEAIYARECASCHGAAAFGDGAAGAKLAIRPTNLRAYIGDKKQGFFAGQVALGKADNPDMPRFVETLTADEIWHVTNYVFSLGPVAPDADTAATPTPD